MTLPKPEMKCSAGIYTFRWQEPKLEIVVDRISENGRADIIGEVAIWHKTPGIPELLERTKLNLSVSISRNKLAKELAQRVPDIDWVSVIKYISVLTINEYRRGEPVIGIGRKPETMEVSYQLYPILEQGQATTIFAPGGSGKSYLADYIAVLVQFNYPGIGNWLPKQGNVLYLDWESSKEVHERRIWAIKQGLGITTEETIFYRYCTQPLASDIQEIQNIVLKYDIILVIVDSQVAASGGDPEKAESANQYYNSLRSLRRTSLTLDHVPKNTEKGKAMPFGSVFKWNRSRSQFELMNYQEPGEDVLELGLYHRKHNEGRLQKPIGIKVMFHSGFGDILEKVTFSESDVRDVPELAKGLSRKEQITAVLKHGGAAISEIAEAIDATKDTIKTELYRHKDRFVKLPNDQWGLLSNDIL